MKLNKKFGILGGMSPQASNYMYDRLIQLSIQNFGAKNNDDFPEIILHSIPVPDFISNDNEKVIALEMLIARVKDINKLNISCISIACNTAHLLLKDLQKVSDAPIVSMIEEVLASVNRDGVKTVGILGSPTTINSKLYQNKLEQFNIEVINPTSTQMREMENIIRNIIKAEFRSEDKIILSKIADDLIARGAEGIILGCTEIPLIFLKKNEFPVYNSVEILVLALLRRYYQYNTIAI